MFFGNGQLKAQTRLGRGQVPVPVQLFLPLKLPFNSPLSAP
jgi:hypothetical protein